MRINEANSKKFAWLLAAVLPLTLAGCGGDSGSSKSDDSVASTGPTVTSTGPRNDAVGVALNSQVVAGFSAPMSPTTLDGSSFTLAAAGQSQETGTVTYDAASNTAAFRSTNNLGANTVYTATVTTLAKSLQDEALASNYAWSFTTGEIADLTPPTVTSTDPAGAAIGVALNRDVSANFSEAMAPATLSTSTFLLTDSDSQAISGTVSYLGTTASFNPANNLDTNAEYTATLTTDVSDLATNALATSFIWSFTTGATTAQGPAPVNLGTAGDYVILAKAGISTTGTTAITGDIGVSPVAESAITGFSQTRDASNEFATSAIVSGKILASDMAPPTPSKLTTAIGDMEIAYTDAAGRTTPDETELGAGDISGMTLAPGLYKWGTGLLLATDVTLSGSANDVWIFQIAKDLTVENGVNLILDGALAKNIFWQVEGGVTLGTTSDFKGTLLSKTGIVVQNGAVLEGRALAQTAVTLDANAVTQPGL